MREPLLALDENIQTWWRSASANKGQWLQVDHGETYDVNAKINFADDKIEIPKTGSICGTTQARYHPAIGP